ncbi:MAG: protein kinase domain-containing protein, partial [Gammaproteobacteria bacterium]
MGDSRKIPAKNNSIWLMPTPFKHAAKRGGAFTEIHSSPTTPSITPRKNKREGCSPPPESTESHPLSAIFSPGTLSTTDSSSVVEFIGADQKNKKMSIFKKINRKDRMALERQHPELAKTLLSSTNADEIDVPMLGKGTFCFVLLGKNEDGKFHAVREILNQQELTSNMQGDIARGQVLFDTCIELEMQKKLKDAGLNDLLLLTEEAVLIRDNKQIQIYQFLPLADLGNGKDIIQRINYLSPTDKDDFFDYMAEQLLHAMIQIHDANVAMNDIKLDNILFTRKGLISFSDFGAACYLNNQNRLKIASALKDINYLAPYAHNMPNCSDSEKLRRYQRQDLWSLALTMLALKDIEMVHRFMSAVIPRRKIFLATNIGANVTPLDDSQELTAFLDLSEDCYTSAEYKPDLSTSLLSIYQEELTQHIFQSHSFLTLSTQYQTLFQQMLNLNTDELNLTIDLKSLMKEFNKSAVSHTKIETLLSKFVTLPKPPFDAYIFEKTKSLIEFLIDNMFPTPSKKLLISALKTSYPGDLANCFSPLMKQFARELLIA